MQGDTKIMFSKSRLQTNTAQSETIMSHIITEIQHSIKQTSFGQLN